MADDMTTTDYAAEAEDTRERIAATIDELQDRLDPRRIVGDAVDSVQASGSDLVQRGVRLVSSHPAAAAGAVLVVGLVALGGNRLSHARVDIGDSGETYSDFDEDYRPASGGSERFALARPGSAARISDNPLVAVAVGFAAGALLGALFPSTERERQLLGEASGRLGSTLRDAVDSVAGQAGEAFGATRGASSG